MPNLRDLVALSCSWPQASLRNWEPDNCSGRSRDRRSGWCAAPTAHVPMAPQPTLRRRIKLGVLAALDQRIGLRYNMPPMTDKETGSYLRHHLNLAGRSDTLFSDDATTLIHQTSRGYP